MFDRNRTALCRGCLGRSSTDLVSRTGLVLYYPRSGAATTVVSGGKNLLIGGDAAVVQELAATNSYWTYLNSFSSIAIAPGVVGRGDPITVYGGSDGANSTNAAISYSPSGDPASPSPFHECCPFLPRLCAGQEW